MIDARHPKPPSPQPCSSKGEGATKLDEGIAIVRERLAKAKNVMVLTGAGVSAESGIPTFRDEKGLWKEFNPLDYATREAFKRDPAKV
jgi:NAD-dependent deacetylase